MASDILTWVGNKLQGRNSSNATIKKIIIETNIFYKETIIWTAPFHSSCLLLFHYATTVFILEEGGMDSFTALENLSAIHRKELH